jgi:large repetitive protein
VFVLTGLNDNNTYTFRFFGSREDATGTTNRNTDYTIGVTTVTLNASNNTTQTVDIEDVSPTDGEIVISVKYGTGATFGYLNAMEIFETSGSGSSMSSMTQAEQFSQPEEHEFVSIYPVPFKDKITITFKEQVDGEVSVSLVGMEGREYFHNEGYVIDQEQPLQIDLSGSNIPRGVYLLKVQSTSGMQSKMRIVKE